MILSGLLIPLLWREQENWGFWLIIDLINDDGMYMTVIIFNILFDRTLYSGLDQTPVNHDHPIGKGF